MSVFHQMEIASSHTIDLCTTLIHSYPFSYTQFRFLLVSKSLRVYCACIRIWLMNVLCDLPIWKSVANAFYTCPEQFTPPTEPLSRDRAHANGIQCVVCGKNVPWNTCLTYIFIILMDFHIGRESLFAMATHKLIRKIFFFCASYTQHTLRYSHCMLNGKSEEV